MTHGIADEGTTAGSGPRAATTRHGVADVAEPAAQEHGLRVLAILAALTGFAPISTDLYLPPTPRHALRRHHRPPGSAAALRPLFAVGILGIMATNVVNVRLVVRFGCGCSKIGYTGLSACGLVLAVSASMGRGGLWGLLISLFVFVSMNGLVVANSIASAMSEFSECAGAVSALVGLLADDTPRPRGWVAVLAGIGSLLCAWRLRPPVKESSEKPADFETPGMAARAAPAGWPPR
ncbi:hypothetical protein [Aureimonas pseudogalii]|uniref:Uncharacterized protein n=1 Tax=Aureimonas pseudogalii TaxID=1744844 RepID=A0A7W6H906_9HYPH|nr:hypothetical protein [Aureimonas pseudogalii]MBB4000816.1 hypothetical protein [Aureimonas pseudogalii]